MSKLTGASLRSLRYYEKLGLLIPACTDPDSGYRYYSFDQASLVEMIQFCIELDIPLKEFGKFADADDIMDYRAFLAQGKEIAQKKLNALKQGLALIEEIERRMDFAERYQVGQIYERKFPKKFFYTKSCGDSLVDVDLFEMAKSVSDFAYSAYREVNYNDLPEHGILCEHSPAGRAYYAFVEVPKRMAGRGIKVIPGGTYVCRQSEDTQIEEARDIFGAYLTDKDSYLAIETDIFTGKQKINKPLNELRVIGL